MNVSRDLYLIKCLNALCTCERSASTSERGTTVLNLGRNWQNTLEQSREQAETMNS